VTVVTSRRGLPSWLPPVLLLTAIAAAFAAVLVLARRAAEPDVPPEPSAFQPPTPARPVTAVDVQQATGGRFALSDGTRDASFAGGARIEVLRPATAADIRPGDWLTVVGIPNEVRNFSIRSLVLIGDPSAADAEGVVRSAGGFAGHEASRDQSERPLLGGVVESVDGAQVVLRGPSGPVTVTFTPAAPLRRLDQGRADEVREGDRIAFIEADTLGDARAVLVLPGGAR
jgi:hypothetical protein